MKHQYDNEFSHDNVYGHASALIGELPHSGGGIHLDFGCGYGRMAEVLRDRYGVRYVGIDLDGESLAVLKARGFDTLQVDLTDADAVLKTVEAFLPANAVVESMSILDVLEHLPGADRTVQALYAISRKYAAPLVVSVPNFAHADIGLRLAMGKFDYTKSGLLDHTHFNYFTNANLTDFMARNGFYQTAAKDVEMRTSDQAFPKELASLAAGTPLNQLLSGLRHGADTFGHTNQLVRLYMPGPLRAATPLIDSTAEFQPDEPFFLTVVTRTQGRRIEELREVLLCLMAQEDQDFHVLVMGHNLDLARQLAVENLISDLPVKFQERVELVRLEGGNRATPLNEAFARSRARYVAMLDDDDLVFGHWTKTFHTLANSERGKLLRATCMTQRWKRMEVNGRKAVAAIGPLESPYPASFDLLDHLIENRTPLHSIAFPKSLYRDLGFRFDNELSTAEDWDFIIRVAPIAGVASSPEVTCIYRRWENGDHSQAVHDQAEWDFNYGKTLKKIDSAPILLPTGTSKRLRAMGNEIEKLKAEVRRLTKAPVSPDLMDEESTSREEEALRWHLHVLLNSRSWRITTPVRAARQWFGGSKLRIEDVDYWRMDAKELEYLIARIEASRSMKLTAPLRAINRIWK